MINVPRQVWALPRDVLNAGVKVCGLAEVTAWGSARRPRAIRRRLLVT
jgi:hypothetical protein